MTSFEKACLHPSPQGTGEIGFGMTCWLGIQIQDVKTMTRLVSELAWSGHPY
jgi:hypothetical protein